MKSMIANSKTKQKSKNNFGSDQKPSFYFHSLLSYCIYYMRKYPIHVTWAQAKTPNTLWITWRSEKNYDKQFTTVTTHKNVQNYYNEKRTYNVNTHCYLLYALGVWNCLNFIWKRRLFFICLIKLLFIKFRWLINVNVSLEADLEGQGW